MKIAVACPSYRRPKCITARYIKDTRIYIDKSDFEDYERANKGFGEIVVCADGIQGNLPRVRNYILDTEFGNGADVVVMMDDDVSSLAAFSPVGDNDFGYQIRKIKEDEFYNFIEYGTTLCREWGFGMWGVNYNQDKKLYHHFQPFSTLKPSVGQFMVFVENDLRFDEKLPLKEDYDMALQQIAKYRGVLLLNFVHVNGDFGKLSGGTACRRNFDAEFEQWKLFRDKWGSDIVTGTAKKKPTSDKKSKTRFVEKYDFSHPQIKVPIKGI